ncbi:hypothetical protein TAMA11512_20550 [Selenomonas sp. TAMA-11512]|uniref:DUF4321 domain-containing protein n=1 Tax=Selenomonas sp. TAMA-11512 TaxID=3095337 RepID=UPI0030855E1B|nr:hypothetical protein TAMA11512_20550 [Selenomonas sp. TAMA-11512]
MRVLYVVLGALLGGFLGNILSDVSALSSLMPYLVSTTPVFVLPPVELSLFVVTVTFGFSFTPNLMSIIGILLALYIHRRYA